MNLYGPVPSKFHFCAVVRIVDALLLNVLDALVRMCLKLEHIAGTPKRYSIDSRIVGAFVANGTYETGKRRRQYFMPWIQSDEDDGVEQGTYGLSDHAWYGSE